jgi:hypothetical protein
MLQKSLISFQRKPELITEAIRQNVQKFASELDVFDHRSCFEGEHRYVPVAYCRPSQAEISFVNVIEKLQDAQRFHHASWSLFRGRWLLKHANKKSALPITDPIKVIKTKNHLQVIDGHHHLYMNILAGGSLIPVQILADLSHVSEKNLLEVMKQNHWFYDQLSDGSRINCIPQLEQMRDNPNRYLASILAMKVRIDIKNAKLHIIKSNNRRGAAWLKINSGIPFLEFHLAHLLRKSGIVYQDKWRSIVPLTVVNDCIHMLKKSQKSQEELQPIYIFQDAKESEAWVENRKLMRTSIMDFLQESKQFSASLES